MCDWLFIIAIFGKIFLGMIATFSTSSYGWEAALAQKNNSFQNNTPVLNSSNNNNYLE
jgi:hypothetical protein